jgi:hypothetical protein
MASTLFQRRDRQHKTDAEICSCAKANVYAAAVQSQGPRQLEFFHRIQLKMWPTALWFEGCQCRVSAHFSNISINMFGCLASVKKTEGHNPIPRRIPCGEEFQH